MSLEKKFKKEQKFQILAFLGKRKKIETFLLCMFERLSFHICTEIFYSDPTCNQPEKQHNHTFQSQFYPTHTQLTKIYIKQQSIYAKFETGGL